MPPLATLRRSVAASPRRTDAVAAAALAAISVAQVLAFPIAPRALGVAIALCSTVPIAFRRPHPVAAARRGVRARPTAGAGAAAGAARARAGGRRAGRAADGRRAAAAVGLARPDRLQEALTNVLKHARGAPTTVHVTWSATALELTVRDAGPGPNGLPSSGHGLVGMQERVRIHGGRLHTGATAGGGFEVIVQLPLP
jgi:hypothetical protein